MNAPHSSGEREPVVAIFDIGKTNKKLFLFNEDYHIRFETSTSLAETVDPDGFPCEDVAALQAWLINAYREASHQRQYIKALNFSGYGASFVHLGTDGKPVAPLYNYLKPFPPALRQKFYDQYGGENKFSVTTASPVLGHLNSGMQLYWLKQEHPEVFQKIDTSLHLPQFLSWVFTGKKFSDLTSLGCHTNLWNFAQNAYHEWVRHEGALEKLAPLANADHTETVQINDRALPVGIGLHDSSAALIPYLTFQGDPFVLLSTGTWSISLNPFNALPLTVEELAQDCLCYRTHSGDKVKASRFFAGHHHDVETRKMAAHFHKSENYFQSVKFNPFETAAWAPDLSIFIDYESAYHAFLKNLVAQQVRSTNLVLYNSDVKRIFVDGGFSNNEVFMNLLARSYPDKEVYAASLHQASAIGAAMAIHQQWNSRPLRKDMISLTRFAAGSV